MSDLHGTRMWHAMLERACGPLSSTAARARNPRSLVTLPITPETPHVFATTKAPAIDNSSNVDKETVIAV